MPRKNRKPGVWDSLDAGLDAADKLSRDFFSDAQAVAVENIPPSHMEQSDEEIGDDDVQVRIDCDGFVSEVLEEQSTPSEPLELMPIPVKLGVTEWGSQFAEVHARVQELGSTSLPKAARYDSRGGHVVKISSLPSSVDFCADVCVVARRVLTPSLYRLWLDVWYENYGVNADRVPQSVQITIMMLCASAWKNAGILPFGRYWKTRVDPEQMSTISVVSIVDSRDGRNARRRARHAAKRTAKLLKKAA